MGQEPEYEPEQEIAGQPEVDVIPGTLLEQHFLDQRVVAQQRNAHARIGEQPRVAQELYVIELRPCHAAIIGARSLAATCPKSLPSRYGRPSNSQVL